MKIIYQEKSQDNKDFMDMLLVCVNICYFQLVSMFSKLKLTILIPRKVSVDSGPAEKMRRRMNKQIVVIIDLDVGI